MRSLLMTPVLTLVLGLPHLVWADSLWLGTDNTSSRSVLNTDLAGNLIQSVGPLEASGIAINAPANLIYFGTSAGVITGRSLSNPGTVLTTINPVTNFAEDMAFDGVALWRVDINAQLVESIDPITGTILSSFDPGFTPLGLAWDGANLWVSEFVPDGLVKQFTTAGVATGNQFNAHLGPANPIGGLAFDTADSTLWIGTWSTLYHYQTDGTQLGSFAVPVNDGRFVDGLEFQTGSTTSAVPEPGSFLLLTTGLAFLGSIIRKKTGNR